MSQLPRPNLLLCGVFNITYIIIDLLFWTGDYMSQMGGIESIEIFIRKSSFCYPEPKSTLSFWPLIKISSQFTLLSYFNRFNLPLIEIFLFFSFLCIQVEKISKKGKWTIYFGRNILGIFQNLLRIFMIIFLQVRNI